MAIGQKIVTMDKWANGQGQRMSQWTIGQMGKGNKCHEGQVYKWVRATNVTVDNWANKKQG